MSGVLLLQSSSSKLEDVQKKIFSKGALEFLASLHEEFDSKIDELYKNRLQRAVDLKSTSNINFKISSERNDKSWKVAPLPSRLQNRQLDLGDVSAANSAHFTAALEASVQGVQVDFDDGHCPTWKNQLLAYNNINLAVNGKLPGAPISIATCPVLMLRPRAWNMIDHDIIINGKEAIGPLVDFGILMYHNAKKLYEANSGPYFYLSKLEGASEAQLWNDIFVWTQNQLDLPQGTIKACVLIENIISTFEMDEILYALREHCMGLNCGIWDYCASIIAKFGDRKEFLLPDRNKYVNMDQKFLNNYMKLVVNTCHSRGALATGGMAASMLNPGSDGTDQKSKVILNKVLEAKLKEIEWGVDGFMVYDSRIVPHLNELWKRSGANPNQINRILDITVIQEDLLLVQRDHNGRSQEYLIVFKFRQDLQIYIDCFTYGREVALWKRSGANPNQINRILDITVTPEDLLLIPSGGVTMKGLKHNIAVSILFIYHWLAGIGHFFYNGNVEDSATAEISRAQIWQWIRFSPTLEDDPKQRVTHKLIEKVASNFVTHAHKNLCRSNAERKRLTAAKYMSIELFLFRNPPEFITSYLNDNHKFRTLHNKALLSNL